MTSPPLPYDFTYIRVPADESEPFEELKATAKTYGDALHTHLQPKFAGGSVKNVEHLRAEYGSAVDEKMSELSLAASKGIVDTFALVRPAKSTLPIAHAGTYLYLDECGVLKDLPVNHRAAQVAARCGLDVESPFLGDVFIGRVVVNPTPMHSASFTLAELDAGSPFFQSAPSENAMYHAAMHEYEQAAKEKKVSGGPMAGSSSSASSSGSSTTSSAEPQQVGSFKWAQSAEDLEVTVVLPAGTGRKQVQVDVGPKTLAVGIKGESSKLVTLQLFAAVRPDESTWTVSSSKDGTTTHLACMMEKVEHATWNTLEAASEGKIL